MKKLLILLGVAGMACVRAAYADPTALEARIAREEQWKSAGLFLLPHRPNYVMPLSYNGNPNNDPFPAGTELEKFETKFQLSLKIPIVDEMFKYKISANLAYTQVSYWQTYNNDNSSLFRDTDYEPEFFLQFNYPNKLGPLINRYNRLGFDHQSNGQGAPLSRSWNRIYAEFVLDTPRTMLSVKPWYRISGPEDQDSNPDIWNFLGYGELRGALKLQRHELSILFRNNLRSPDNKGAVELGWSFPLIRSMKGFIQYFNGYGESLLDYNVPVSRVSAGVSFSDWL